MNVFSTSLIGRRTSNEDEHHIILNKDGKQNELNKINFYAVYDGHGGNKVSKFLKKNLALYFMKKDVVYPLDKDHICKIFDHLQKKLAINHKDFAYASGSTCLVIIDYVHKNNNYLHIINIGDCRAVLCTNNFALPLTKDHKPHWPEEKLRIQQLGGEIYYDGLDYRIGDLSVSRSFGDMDGAPYITCEPDIFKHKISQNDQFIVMACDGLWDVLQNCDVVNFILENVKIHKGKCKIIDKRINIAKKLAEYAINKGSTDNISIIIIFL